jgi:hypothetical protein
VANKQVIKKSEARILVYLNNVKSPNKYASQMSYKLNIEYGYLIRLLKQMVHNDWIIPIRRSNKIFYEINNETAPLSKATELLQQANK